MNEVDRGTLNDKLGSLVDESNTFLTEMWFNFSLHWTLCLIICIAFHSRDHMTKLNGLPVHFSSSRYEGLKSFSILLSFLINIIMVGVLDRSVIQNTSSKNTPNSTILGMNSERIIYSLGLLQLICTLLMFVLWLLLNLPVVLTKNWQSFVDGNSYLINSTTESKLEYLTHPKYFSTQQTTYALKTKGPTYHKFLDGKNLHFGNLWGYVKYYETSFMLLFREG